MNNNTPVTPRPLSHLVDAVRRRVFSAAQLREHGVAAARAAAQCRPGGPWQQLLPGVYLLHPGAPTSEERLHAVLLYAGRPGPEAKGVPAQPGSVPSPSPSVSSSVSPSARPPASPYGGVMVTGLAALALHGFGSTPGLRALDVIDVLVPRTRRLRSTGFARLIRAHALPRPELVTGVPVAPVARAVADAVAELSEAADVRAVLAEAVRGGHCEPAAVVRELNQARLLARPHVVDAVDALLAEGRSLAEGRLYEMVRTYALPEPVWNVDLRLPGGLHLGGVDAYWPEQAVAVELDTRAPRQGGPQDDDAIWSEYARKREHLERLGVTVVHLTPRKLRESLEQQAMVVGTALTAADERDPAAYVVVLPR
ncbi:hypothetical protein [Streptomyces liangshanensis]|uniref:DUF559 domain-containing protein n=1 Tax=Streptomyces liangshanensis TaxID=2717324 RepID=A0A6G9H2W3_9ACTN|nr:hypothetical protein [Streptomyces liangshanensis]QIQ04810.1 hypothetical protein HA039_23280 [Streptomyces liangshanensis]